MQITKVEMPAIFVMLCLFGGLYISSKTGASPLNNTSVEWHNRNDKASIINNDTKSEILDTNQTVNLGLNNSKNDLLPLTKSSTSTITSSTTASVITSSDAVESPNKTQNSNPFRVSRLLEYSAFSWLKNEYVVSIVIPIAAGIGSGLVLIILLNVWRCARAKCQRGCCRKRNRNLPKHIKQMKLADRMKLLAESSDEEF